MTTSLMQIAKSELLTPASLDESAIDRLLHALAHHQIDDGDLYFQRVCHESWHLEDSQVKTGSFSEDCGVGIRAISGDKTGYAYSDDLLFPSIERALFAARSIALSGQKKLPQKVSSGLIVPRYAAQNPILSLENTQKIALLKLIDEIARKIDPRVIQVQASLSATHEVVLIAGFGRPLAADVRPQVSLHVSVMVEGKDGVRESARSGGGGRVPLQFFFEEERFKHYAEEAVREALVNLEAGPAPAGTMPVVLGPGWPGVLLHEAVGHGLEGDFNRKGLSAFSGKLGEQVASKGVTVVDDGTLLDRRGSLTVDDEGTPTQCTTLIEDGVLVNYMQDRLNAHLMNMKPTGNGRRESYAAVPMPRMTNTYMLSGGYQPQEIIQSVKKGLYAVNFGGGQVDITSGQFVFSASEAYLIEDGKVTRPVKGAMLIGNGPQVMKEISMIGNDMKLDGGMGTCGKDGQSVPVGVGQPTLKIDALTVGGTGTNG